MASREIAGERLGAEIRALLVAMNFDVGQPRPGLSIDDAADRMASDPKAGRNDAVQLTGSRAGANLADLFSVQLLTAETVLPAFSDRIVHVLGLRAEEQVRRVAAVGVVTAGAVVTNVQPVRYRAAVCQLPCDNRRIPPDALRPLPAEMHLATAARQATATPRPTRIRPAGLVHTSPEPPREILCRIAVIRRSSRQMMPTVRWRAANGHRG